MPRAAAILLVLVGAVCSALLLLLTVPLPFADPLLLPLSVALPMLLMMLGAVRRRASGWVLAGLVLVLVELSAVVVGLWLLRGRPLDGPALLGLPPSAALLLLGLAALPLPWVGALFASWWSAAARRDPRRPREEPG